MSCIELFFRPLRRIHHRSFLPLFFRRSPSYMLSSTRLVEVVCYNFESWCVLVLMSDRPRSSPSSHSNESNIFMSALRQSNRSICPPRRDARSLELLYYRHGSNMTADAFEKMDPHRPPSGSFVHPFIHPPAMLLSFQCIHVKPFIMLTSCLRLSFPSYAFKCNSCLLLVDRHASQKSIS